MRDVTENEQQIVALIRDPLSINDLVISPCEVDGVEAAVIALRSDEGISPVAIIMNEELFGKVTFPDADKVVSGE